MVTNLQEVNEENQIGGFQTNEIYLDSKKGSKVDLHSINSPDVAKWYSDIDNNTNEKLRGKFYIHLVAMIGHLWGLSIITILSECVSFSFFSTNLYKGIKIKKICFAAIFYVLVIFVYDSLS